MIIIDTNDLRLKIKNTEDNIKYFETQKLNLTKEYSRAMKPAGVHGGTSYEDYDTIHGSRKEYRLDNYFNKMKFFDSEIKRNEKLLSIYRKTLTNSAKEAEIDEFLKLLGSNKEKVDYLVNGCEFTQKKAAIKLNISEQRVYQICRTLREEKLVRDFNEKGSK